MANLVVIRFLYVIAVCVSIILVIQFVLVDKIGTLGNEVYRHVNIENTKPAVYKRDQKEREYEFGALELHEMVHNMQVMGNVTTPREQNDLEERNVVLIAEVALFAVEIALRQQIKDALGKYEPMVYVVSGTMNIGNAVIQSMNQCQSKNFQTTIDKIACWTDLLGAGAAVGLTLHQQARVWGLYDRIFPREFGEDNPNNQLYADVVAINDDANQNYKRDLYQGYNTTVRQVVTFWSETYGNNVTMPIRANDTYVGVLNRTDDSAMIGFTTDGYSVKLHMLSDHQSRPSYSLNSTSTDIVKRYDAFDGLAPATSLGIKILCNTKAGGLYLYQDVENWARIDYGNGSPAQDLWGNEMYAYSFGMATKSAECEQSAQFQWIWEVDEFNQDWETNHDWCWGSCATNCQFAHQYNDDCQVDITSQNAWEITYSSNQNLCNCNRLIYGLTSC